jgi:urease subunit beta
MSAKKNYVVPGEYILGKGDIEINAGRKVLKLKVTNKGDRPIQVGSHFHFAETNSALEFDRKAAEGHRLNVPAGLSTRFEPGETNANVELVPYAGGRVVRGFSLRHLEQRENSLKSLKK